MCTVWTCEIMHCEFTQQNENTYCATFSKYPGGKMICPATLGKDSTKKAEIYIYFKKDKQIRIHTPDKFMIFSEIFKHNTEYLASFLMYFINQTLHSICIGFRWVGMICTVKTSVGIRDWCLHESNQFKLLLRTM